MADGQIVIDTRIDSSGVDKGVGEIQGKLNQVGQSMQSVGQSMTQYVTVPLMALGAGALKIASDFDGSQAKIQNSLGLTGKEAEVLNKTVQNVWKEGFGESVGDVTNSLLEVKQNMKGLNDGDIEQATKSAMVLAQTFDSDVNEVTRAGGNIMSSFGTTSQEAFDLMAYGAQNGLNFSKEMFDNLSEYGPLFADAGYSADEMFQALINGAKTGTYNLDYLNDAVKEFGVKAVEGGDGFVTAISKLSPETQKVFKEFQNGKATIKDVMDSAVGDLNGMEDEVLKNQLGVELWGTKWEDVGSEAILAMGGVSGALDGAKGSMDGMVAVQEQTFGQRFQSMLRELGAALLPLGEVLMNMASAIMPYLAAAVQTVSEWFSNLSPAIQTAVTIFGIIAAVLGPVITVLGMVVGAISNLIGPIMTAVSWFTRLSALGPIFGTVMSALAGPIGIVIAAVGLLVAAGIALYKNWDEVKAFLKQTWEMIKETAVTVFNSIKDFFAQWGPTILAVLTGPIGLLVKMIASNWDTIKSTTSTVWNAIKSFISSVWESIKSSISSVMNSIQSTISSIWNAIKSTVTTAVNGIKTTITTIFNSFKSTVETAMTNVKTAIETGWDKAQAFLEDIDLFQIGADIISGLIEGIGSMAGKLWDKAASIANSVSEAVSSTLGVHSPSRVMIGIGKWIPIGLAEGMAQSTKAVMDASYQMAGAATSGMSSVSTQYDYSRKMSNTININSNNPSSSVERTLRRLEFEYQ